MSAAAALLHLQALKVRALRRCKTNEERVELTRLWNRRVLHAMHARIAERIERERARRCVQSNPFGFDQRTLDAHHDQLAAMRGKQEVLFPSGLPVIR